MAWKEGYKHVMLEVDLRVVLKLLTRSETMAGYEGKLVERCRRFPNQDYMVELNHIYREVNSVSVGSTNSILKKVLGEHQLHPVSPHP